MLRILHTADWHIGKNLHKVPMHDEIKIYFDWLINLIIEREIDILLVSGDVFDYANPSAEDRLMYFNFLKRLIDTDTKTIITGGNHDSAGFLNSPRQILGALNITVVGEAMDDLQDEIVELRNSEGELELVIAAVPFLKEKNLRHRDGAHLYSSKTEEIRAGIAKHYADIAEICSTKYAGIPAIAMGHLYAIGSEPSESERDIHMGNEAAVGSSIFGDAFEYVALGHIHRPQVVGGNEYIRYSGSPISLSFSEKKDLKSIVLLEVNDGQVKSPELIPVPKQRELVRISGTFSEVQSSLETFQTGFPLPAFLELEIKEDNFSNYIIEQVETLKQSYNDSPNFKIIKSQISFKEGAKDLNELFSETINIEDLKPLEVFSKKIEMEEMEDALRSELKEMFLEVLDHLENEN